MLFQLYNSVFQAQKDLKKYIVRRLQFAENSIFRQTLINKQFSI